MQQNMALPVSPKHDLCLPLPWSTHRADALCLFICSPGFEMFVMKLVVSFLTVIAPVYVPLELEILC